MNRIVLPPEIGDKLRGTSEPAEVFDSVGNKLGTFTPGYVGYECPTPVEELLKIAREQERRPLADILRDLERRA